jgi:hypothetical protein
MGFSRLQIGPREMHLSLLTILVTIVFAIAGVQWGFLIPFAMLFAILLIVVIVLDIKIGLILLLCSYFYVRPIYYLPFSILTYIRLDDILWGLVMVSWLVNLRKTKRMDLRSLPLFGALTLFFVIAMLSGIRVLMLSPTFISIGNFIWFLMRLFQYVSVYFIVGSMNFTNRERNSFFTLIIIAGMGTAAIIFLQYWEIMDVFSLPRYIETAGAITGTFSFKTEIGAVAMILTLLVLDKIIQHKWNRWLGLLLLGCFSVLLLISQSRSAWVAFLVGMIVYLFLMRSLQTIMIWGTILLAAGILFFGMQGNRQLYNSHPIIDPVTGRISQDEAVSARLTSLPLIFQYLAETPDVIFFGVGFMNWRYTLSTASGIYGAHNNYLTALAELGLFGLAAFCYFLLRSLLIAWKNTKLNQPFSQFFLSVLVGLCAASFFEDIFWPAVAQESFLAFFLFISALSLPSVLSYAGRTRVAQLVK